LTSLAFMRFCYHIQGMELLEAMVAGWRYLFSRSYRLKKHQDWRENGWFWMTFEIIYGVSGILFSIGLPSLVALALWK
jgi:hypothetical protein